MEILLLNGMLKYDGRSILLQCIVYQMLHNFNSIAAMIDHFQQNNHNLKCNVHYDVQQY